MSADDAGLADEGVEPYAGNFLGWLGGIPDNDWDHYTVTLTQDVAIPDDAATLSLTGFRDIVTEDDPSEPYDVAYIQLEDADGDVLWQAQAWSNLDTTDGWVPFESSTTDLDDLRGQTVTFVAYSDTDPEAETSFFLDNLRLVASCGR